ncbi:phosphoribosylanthranilate isomerase [Desulfopila sp. IMCC35008]|uniref:phosphoribosylanthranilate isomerase n=1 Tax=Desulfopila sp. IMCC35008 TaxID=2653858 RepID=UPI0013D1E030|nr:phosphoribosylanthranilate isomerase [Desulfopila sp. IMCC35008]
MQRRTRIKVCGTTTLHDATAAIDCGVDALGFIFVDSSPRYISPEKAREITMRLPPFVHFVGVFVDQDPVEIKEISRYCNLSTIQLHGKETPDYCQVLRKTASPCTVIKAFRVGADSSAGDFKKYSDFVDGYLLDTYVKGQEGGTGEVFDWSVIESLKLDLPFMLAGGLTPENVEAAVSSVRPYGIDINSGVEKEPGVKDHEKLFSLIQRVLEFDRLSGNNEGSGVTMA